MECGTERSLPIADTCFVVSWEKRSEIGQGKPGPVTKKLQKGFAQLTKTEGVKL